MKQLVYDNAGIKVFKYLSGGYEYREIHVGGKIITVESLSYMGVFVK
jgi:hypothetical protein